MQFDSFCNNTVLVARAIPVDVRYSKTTWSVSINSLTALNLSCLVILLDNVVGVAQLHAVKACGGVEVETHSFFTCALDGGE
jgi:hypothetical protein